MIPVAHEPRPTRQAIAEPWRIEPLLVPARPAATNVRGGLLPSSLSGRYGADLAISLRRSGPTIVSNFVSTIDGVVAFDVHGESGGREVSGAFAPDRFLMGLLRATADAVLVGAGTLRSGTHHAWTPRYVFPPSTEAFAAWRRQLGLAASQPTTVIVTASGAIDPAHPGLIASDVPVLLLTTCAGSSRLRGTTLTDNVEIVVVGNGEWIEPIDLRVVLADRGFELVVCEGGPILLGGLVNAGLVDELFLTVAPQIAGRTASMPRLGLVEGVGFAIDKAPWATLISVMRSDDHLFMRYRMDAPTRGIGGRA